VFSPEKGDPSDMTGGAGIFDGSEPWILPISTRETAVAYTRPLGWDLNSKFFLYKFM
jgi:hypothetical protein